MIDYSDFVIENEKPIENKFFLFRVADPVTDKECNTIAKMAEASKSGIFTSGVYYIPDILNRLRTGYFPKITYKKENDKSFFLYDKNGETRKVLLPSNLSINDLTNIIRDSGYDVSVEFKTKAYKRKKSLYDYNVFFVKEKLQNKIFKELKITEVKIASVVFDKCWEDSKYNPIQTQICFMKQIILFKKIGEKL